MAVCDHKSAGILNWQDQKLLMIGRVNFPFGYAPPAGHVDDRRSFEEAAREELFEEVGLHAGNLELIIEGRVNNRCKRENGTWHHWSIFRSKEVTGNILLNRSEARVAIYVNKDEIVKMCKNTLRGSVKHRIEPVWVYWFNRLQLIELSQQELETIGRML